MSRRFYSLPALSALSTFEAAARTGSFRNAAQELNVTPGAVSHQVRALEKDLGIALFDRLHRGVALTPSGETLFRALRGAFLDVSAAIETLRGTRAANNVTVAATTAMSALWMTPNLSRFWREHADIRVNQVVSDRLEFGSQNPDIVLSYGPLGEAKYSSEPLFRDTLLPVCAPGLARLHGPDTIEALATLPLVHLDAPDARWTTWHTWFAEQGFSGPLRRGTTVNNYMIALQAAEDGVGMVLGWERLVRGKLQSGELVGFDAFATPAPTSFFLSRFEPTGGLPSVNLLADWIKSTAAQI